MKKIIVLIIAALTAITGMYAQEMHIHRNDGTIITVPINAIDSLIFDNGNGGDTPPTAAFTATPMSGTVPLTVNFTDQSANNPTSWLWNFGDGNSSTQQNPQHTYQNAGNFTVDLTVTNSHGTDAETKTNFIEVTQAGSAPEVAFVATPTSGTAPLTVNFTDQSTNNPTSWNWNFGDGSTSTQQNPSHTYQSAGDYTVQLTVSNSHGSDTETKNNYIQVESVGGGGQPCPGIPSFIYGGQTYNTVLISNQCWMAENLNYLTGSSWCYDNDPANCATYGRLYDWQTARNACPPGWHLPTDEEWKILEGTVDSQYGVGQIEWNGTGWRGSDVGKKLKATSSWSTSGNGTDDYGFGALASGRLNSGGNFYGIGYSGDWWSAKESSTSNAWYRRLYYGYNKAGRGSDYKGYGFSVRCLKDSGGSGNGCEGITEFTYGGQTYNTVEIADQCWMAENLNFATGNSWCYDNDTANCAVYGRIYNWQTAINACPPGWHLPTDEEWKILEGTVDSQYGVGHSEWNGTGLRGSDVGKKLKATTNWFSGGNGTDDYDFGALAGGYRNHDGGFSMIEHNGNWWSATDLSTPHAWIRSLSYSTDKASRSSRHEGLGYSVRCIKDYPLK